MSYQHSLPGKTDGPWLFALVLWPVMLYSALRSLGEDNRQPPTAIYWLQIGLGCTFTSLCVMYLAAVGVLV